MDRVTILGKAENEKIAALDTDPVFQSFSILCRIVVFLGIWSGGLGEYALENRRCFYEK